MISIDEFKNCEIMAGEILSAEPIEGSDKLLKLSVDFGEDLPAGRQGRPRTVVSGVKKYFPDPQELVGVKCAFATNLELRPLMGIPSEAMLLAASAGDKLSPLRIDEGIPAGTRIN